MANKYQQVADLLRESAKEVKVILADSQDEMHSIKITNDLERLASYIVLITGSGDTSATEIPVLGPAKTIGGVPIKKVRRFTADELVPSDDKKHELKQAVESAIFYFKIDRTPESLIAQIPDLVIRGLAKKVGMPWSAKDIKVVSPEYVAEIQEKVKEQFADDDDEDDEDDLNFDASLEKETLGGDSATKLPNPEPETAKPETEVAKVVPIDGEGAAAADANQAKEKQEKISKLQGHITAKSQQINELKAKIPNSKVNKQPALNQQLAQLETEYASLTKQLEDANKD